jgi:S1-C subfamily serine protease
MANRVLCILFIGFGLVLSVVGLAVTQPLLSSLGLLSGLLVVWFLRDSPWWSHKGLGAAVVIMATVGIVWGEPALRNILPRSTLSAGKASVRLNLPVGSLVDTAPDHIRHAMDANVLLVVETRSMLPFVQPEVNTGSGVVLAKKGTRARIVTNRHVIDPGYVGTWLDVFRGETTITAVFSDGSRRRAQVSWLAEEGLDAAEVRTGVDPVAIPEDAWSPPPMPRVGDRVFVVGNPHDLGWSYTEGVISGIRELQVGSTTVKVFQTQAPVNEGNSGGGLYSSDGRLIGLVSWTRDKSQTEGISFALALGDVLGALAKDKQENPRTTAAGEPDR